MCDNNFQLKKVRVTKIFFLLFTTEISTKKNI